MAGLQAQIDLFVEHYNRARPHRARGNLTPFEAVNATDPARPGSPTASRHLRVRTDRVDVDANVTLRYQSRLLHIDL